MLLAGLLLSLLCLNVKDMSKINTPTEIWKPIKGYEGRYEISNIGRVRNTSLIIMKQRDDQPYATIYLYDGVKYKWKLVHRLVAEAFILNPQNKPQVNHKNGIKKDNIHSNLEWATRSENAIHSFANGLQVIGSGVDNHLSKSVYQFSLDGNLIACYGSAREAARVNGFFNGNISGCCTGRIKTYKGFLWSHSKSLTP